MLALITLLLIATLAVPATALAADSVGASGFIRQIDNQDTSSDMYVQYHGRVFIGDSTVDIILALRDDDADGEANDASEHQVFFDSNNNASGIVMASVRLRLRARP